MVIIVHLFWGYFLVMSADLTTPAAKTGSADVFVASPLKKGGKWWYYVLVGCVLLSKREVATPRGWRTGLGSGCVMILLFLCLVLFLQAKLITAPQVEGRTRCPLLVVQGLVTKSDNELGERNDKTVMV